MREPIHVLHVDDDPSFLGTASTLLTRERDRFTVETAAGTEEAKRRLEASPFDCVVSDYDMPGENGIEFLRWTRERYQQLPFVLFTGQGSEAVASEAISAGVTEYLQKGPGTEQYELLAHRIENAVEGHRAAERAETLDRVRTLLADISGALIRASSEAAAEASVCEIISGADPYQFAWIGTHDPETDRIEPEVSAGIQTGYLDEITITADDTATGRGPAGRAIRTREIAVSQNVREDPTFERWRQPALDRGFRSVAAVPLVYDDTVYGVLAVYADRTDAFDETERELLAELGNNVSHAIHSFRIRTEQRRTNSLLSTLLDLLPVGVLAEDTERNVLAINRQLFELFGISEDPDAVVGTDCAQLASDVAELFEDAATFPKRIEELIAAGGSVDGETLRLADGRTFERSYRPIELPDGNGHLWVYRDVTDRERRTKELEELTAHLRREYEYLFEEAPVMAVVTKERNGEPIIEDCDRLFAGTVGYDESEIVGSPLADFYTPESRAELLESGGYERALVGEFDREFRELVTADGEIVETLLRAIPRRDVPFETDGTLGLFIDLTERERLKRERDRLEEFADIVSHDLRNPLNVASGRLELARADADSEHLDAIAEAHGRMNTLIENLLVLARGGEQPETIQSIDLSEIVETCWRNVETGTATLETVADRTIQADRSRLSQLFENLFRNSIEHGGADLTVTVGDLEDGFYVADDGTGIPSESREQVFESGYSEGSGTGLGLAIVERIADAHGWTVRVTESESGGARFEITGVDTASG